MGNVLAFPAKPQPRDHAKAAISSAAEVAILPGVRIERREFTPDEARRLGHLPRVRGNSRHDPTSEIVEA